MTPSTPVVTQERMETGLEVVRFGFAGEPPIGSMDAMDQADPLALTAREQAIVASWEEGSVAIDPDGPESLLSADHPDVEAMEEQYSLELTDSGLMIPAAEQAEEQSAQEAPGFFSGMADRVGSFVKKHPKLAKSVAALGVVTAASAVFAETARGYNWSHLGGDPLFPGGAKNEKEFIRNITSPKGKEALGLLGLNKRERGALIRAARAGEAESCRTEVGEKFEKMTYGINGPSVVDNVTFADSRYAENGAPAWCLKVRIPRKNGGYEVVELETPKKCSNFAIKARKVIVPPTPEKPPTGKLVLTKAFEDANGNPLSVSGQKFLARCFVKGVGVVTNKFEYNPAHRRGPVTALKGCKVGKPGSIMELTTPEDLAHWDVKTGKPVMKDGQIIGYVMKQEVDRGRNLFGFKNVQRRPDRPGQPPTVPPTVIVPNSPPTGRMDLHQRIVNTTDKVCVSELADANGDAVSVTDFVFRSTASGLLVGEEVGSIYSIPGTNNAIQCQDYKAPSTPQEVGVTATLTDGKPNNGTTNIFNTMPITPEQR